MMIFEVARSPATEARFLISILSYPQSPPLYGAIDDEFARDGFGVHLRQFTHRDAMTRHAYGTFDFTVDVQVLFRRNRSSDFYACAYVGR